jgi:hypothetical protein
VKPDPIVEEIRRIREARAARFEFDPRAIAEDSKKREKAGGRKVVVPPPPRVTK